MVYLETNFGLMETFCQAVTEWFDNEKVNIDKCHLPTGLRGLRKTNLNRMFISLKQTRGSEIVSGLRIEETIDYLICILYDR